jgi:serine/threonine protein kinase
MLLLHTKHPKKERIKIQYHRIIFFTGMLPSKEMCRNSMLFPANEEGERERIDFVRISFMHLTRQKSLPLQYMHITRHVHNRLVMRNGLPELDVKRCTRYLYSYIDRVKPENILLVSTKRGGTDTEFSAKIGDFGLAKKAEKNEKRKSDPYLRGSALYMTPESVVDHVQEAPSDI